MQVNTSTILGLSLDPLLFSISNIRSVSPHIGHLSCSSNQQLYIFMPHQHPWTRVVRLGVPSMAWSASLHDPWHRAMISSATTGSHSFPAFAYGFPIMQHLFSSFWIRPDYAPRSQGVFFFILKPPISRIVLVDVFLYPARSPFPFRIVVGIGVQGDGIYVGHPTSSTSSVSWSETMVAQ